MSYEFQRKTHQPEKIQGTFPGRAAFPFRGAGSGDDPPAIVGVSVGLFFLFAGFSIKLAAWKQVNDKTVKNSGIGFTSVLTILFAAMKLTGYTDWRWI